MSDLPFRYQISLIYRYAYMGAGDQSAQEQWLLPAGTSNTGRATEALLRAAASAGFTSTATGANSFRFTRTFRPRWATVMAVAGAPVCGLGLLFLRTKRTETAEATVLEDRAGVRVQLSGALSATSVGALRSHFDLVNGTARLDSGAGSPVSPPRVDRVDPPARGIQTFAAPAPTAVVGGVAPSTWTPPDLLAGGTSLALRFDDGRTVIVDGGAVVGRDPQPDPALPNAVKVALADLSLSRTHSSIGRGHDGLWVVDRHSTNGVRVSIDDRETVCQPGQRVRLPVGGVVTFGSVSARVVQA